MKPFVINLTATLFAQVTALNRNIMNGTVLGIWEHITVAGSGKFL